MLNDCPGIANLIHFLSYCITWIQEENNLCKTIVRHYYCMFAANAQNRMINYGFISNELRFTELNFITISMSCRKEGE